MTKPRICIIAFKNVRSTIHVLRQIHYLAPDHDLTLIGHGTPDPAWPSLTWHAVPEAGLGSKLARLVMYALGRVIPAAYDVWYWHTLRFVDAYHHALHSGADAIHANDWQALPIAIEVARRTRARVVFHQHEYAELEREDSAIWRWLVSPALRRLLTRYTQDPDVRVDRSITVCSPIAERYRRELGIHPIVVYNAPARANFLDASRQTTAAHIRLIHHGYAQRGRGIDRMIQAVALSDRRFTLDLMLMNDNPTYIRELKRLAERLAPDRISFRAPVPPLEIVQTVAAYDVGLCVIQPSTYNSLMMLPNKLFEYIQAGLAVCVGPSPAMAEIVRDYEVGVCAAGFEPQHIADALGHLTAERIQAMRCAAGRAAATLNAEVEMAKIVALYQDLWNAPGTSAGRAP
ncbi:MAG: glycosyltransferase family 4 protein [Chloroflexota bacterium]|nr:glycosyltransferase family 4 protein [Chloroflexota bacterium]